MKNKISIALSLFVGLLSFISCNYNSDSGKVAYASALHLRSLKIDSMDLYAQQNKIMKKMTEQECDSIPSKDQQLGLEQQKTKTTDSTEKPSIDSIADSTDTAAASCMVLREKYDSIQVEIDNNRDEIELVTKINGEVPPPDDGDTDPPCPIEAECNYSKLKAILVSDKFTDFKIEFFNEEGKPVEGIIKTVELENSFKKYIINEDLTGSFTVKVEYNLGDYEFKMNFPEPKKLN